MKTYISQSGISEGIDFDAHYTVSGYAGIAFYLLGWKAASVPVMCLAIDPETGDEYEVESGEYDTEPDYQTVIAVMVGDDRKHSVDVSDLTIIPEESFCRSCGQIGCGCNVYA